MHSHFSGIFMKESTFCDFAFAFSDNFDINRDARKEKHLLQILSFN